MDQPVTASLTLVSLPLLEPFRTATGVIDRRSVVLVAVGEGSGGDATVGWGEAAPFPGQDETIDQLMEAAAAGCAMPTLAAAIDEAIADLGARRRHQGIAPGGGTRVPISVAVGIDGATDRVADLVRRGVTAFKVKIAPGSTRHLADLRAAHPEVTIGVDANGSFRALDGLVELLSSVGVAYAEELVVADFRGSLEPLMESGIPHFADESIRTVADAQRLLASDRYTGVTIKPGRIGWSGACAVRDVADEAGRAWRASGLLETGLGRAFTDRLAAMPHAFTSDVAPAEWFLGASVAPRTVEDGHIVVPDGPGIGVEPDLDAIEAYVVDRRDVVVSR